MVFSSNLFLYLFLPLFLAGYWLARGMEAKNAVLLTASLIFYAYGEPVFVAVLLISVAVNWQAGLAIAKGVKGALAAGVAWNLAVLGIAKYADFAVETVNAVTGGGIPAPGIELPLGVSFFSFQAISYLVDVKRGAAPAERRASHVALYITMFPQLVAGPIVRYATVARQISHRRHSLWRSVIGVRVFIIGLAQKVMIANEIGRVADVAFANGTALDAWEAWAGIVSYSLQIYYDFSGYSLMAIGLGLLLGFGFPRNFRLPYTAGSVTGFWRRWHMSLSRWFRDYLYIPLGGNRAGPARTYANLMIVFLLCGLWHGASWTFVIWGLHHGVFLVLERAWLGRWLARMPALASQAYCLLAVMTSWVWFRAESLADALAYFGALAGLSGNGVMDEAFGQAFGPAWFFALAAGTVLALTPQRVWNAIFGAAGDMAARLLPTTALQNRLVMRNWISLGLFAVSLTLLADARYNPFLYFRF
ncbi:MBOAT family O-acyltransferase [Zhengella sp. ZM62]|uniref:MBOAT family O-acyltransferase n=1 Tax=Zhengella sedimenti TaxID=3390035 RepID=UPI0039756521